MEGISDSAADADLEAILAEARATMDACPTHAPVAMLRSPATSGDPRKAKAESTSAMPNTPAPAPPSARPRTPSSESEGIGKADGRPKGGTPATKKAREAEGGGGMIRVPPAPPKSTAALPPAKPPPPKSTSAPAAPAPGPAKSTSAPAAPAAKWSTSALPPAKPPPPPPPPPAIASGAVVPTAHGAFATSYRPAQPVGPPPAPATAAAAAAAAAAKVAHRLASEAAPAPHIVPAKLPPWQQQGKVIMPPPQEAAPREKRQRGGGANAAWHTAWHKAKREGADAEQLFLHFFAKPK